MVRTARLVLIGVLVVAACADTSPVPSEMPSATPDILTTTPSAPVARVCPELAASYLPPGFSLAQQRDVGSGAGFVGVGRTYTDRGGRAISVQSGVPGEVGGNPTGESLTVRGYRATVTQGPDTITALWFEASLDQPCNQYWVTTVGLPILEFRKIVAGIR